MRDAQKRAVRNYRKRLSKKGMVRVEMVIAEAHVQLLRDMASLLNERAHEKDICAFMKHAVEVARTRPSFKAFLASAPLEDIDFSRDVDSGRDVIL